MSDGRPGASGVCIPITPAAKTALAKRGTRASLGFFERILLDTAENRLIPFSSLYLCKMHRTTPTVHTGKLLTPGTTSKNAGSIFEGYHRPHRGSTTNTKADPIVRLMQILMTIPKITPTGAAAAPTMGMIEVPSTKPASPSEISACRPSMASATNNAVAPLATCLLCHGFCLLLAQCQHLRGVRGYNLVLGI